MRCTSQWCDVIVAVASRSNPSDPSMRAWRVALAVCMVFYTLRCAAADGVSACNTFNVYGARVKLRDYPGKAGPIRQTGIQHYNACYSVTLSFLDLFSDTNLYAVIMDGYMDDEVDCDAYFSDFLRAIRRVDPANINDWLNSNQVFQHNFTYNGGWHRCCNTPDLCNGVVQPPQFQLGSISLDVPSCNSFNEDRGWRFFSDPAAAKPITQRAGNYSNCYSLTIQLGRGTQTMYYSELGGFNPDLFDGMTGCEDYINRTLRMYVREKRFETKFNYNYTDAWVRCCNATNCNQIVIPPTLLTASRLLPAPLLQIASMLLALTIVTLLRP